MKKGGHFVGHVRYGAGDIRYTRSKDGQVFYATLLGAPAGPVTLSRVAAKDPGTGRGRVALLGSEAEVRHEVDAQGRLVIHPPQGEMPTPFAHAFRITGIEVSLAEE